MTNGLSKRKFEKYLDAYYRGIKRPLWTEKAIDELIKLIELYNTHHRSSVEFRNSYAYLRRYKLSTTVYEKRKIVKRLLWHKPPHPCLVPKEKFFQILSILHIAGDHASRAKMDRYVKKLYLIPSPVIDILCTICKHCKKRSRKSSKYTGLPNAPDLTPKEKLKLIYNERLNKYYSNNSERMPWTKENLTNVIKSLKNGSQYKHFGKIKKLLTVLKDSNGIDYVVWKLDNSTYPKLLSSEEFFDKIHQAHLNTNHGDLKTIRTFIYDKYHIPAVAIQIYLECCHHCKGTIKYFENITKQNLVKFMGVFHLMDISSETDENWLLIYHYHGYNFVQLRALKSNNSVIVSNTLLDIFKEYGIPQILTHSCDNKLFKKVIGLLKVQLLDCMIKIDQNVKYKLENKYSCFYTKMKIMLSIWKKENTDIPLSLGCIIIQNRHNEPTNKIKIIQYKKSNKTDTDANYSLNSDIKDSYLWNAISTDENMNISSDNKFSFDYESLLEASDLDFDSDS